MDELDRQKERLLEAQRNQRKALDEAILAVENAQETLKELRVKLNEDSLRILGKFDKAMEGILGGLK